MNPKTVKVVSIAAGVAVLAVAGVYFATREPERKAEPPKPGIFVDAPQADAVVSFPLMIKGRVTGEGDWIAFEGHAGTVQAFDAQGPISEIGALLISDDWTILPASFSASLGTEDNVSRIKANTGYLLFKNENPSGEQGRNREFRVPVRYEK